MIHRGPFQPLPFRDSVRKDEGERQQGRHPAGGLLQITQPGWRGRWSFLQEAGRSPTITSLCSPGAL